jgi:hypothetical protein
VSYGNRDFCPLRHVSHTILQVFHLNPRHVWQLFLCPGGSTEGQRQQEVLQDTGRYIPIYMINCNDFEAPYEILFTYSVKDANRDIAYEIDDVHGCGVNSDPVAFDRSRVLDASNNILLN